MPPENVERKLAAILSADVKGYSRLMGEDEVGTLRTLTASREVTDSLIQQHRGRVVGTAGDSILAEFASAVEAVRCAVEIQQTLKVKNAELPSERRMEFRIGINVGDVIVEGPQIYGDGVNIAARLEALAEGGGVCISGTVYDQVENKLPLSYESLGEQTVKNIAKPVRVYRVVEPKATAITQSKGEVAAPLLPLPDKPSLVVLPFVNMSQDPEQEYFSDGLTEDLTTSLSQLSSLFVIARTSAFTYKGKAVKVQEVGKELGVRYVLEGSVRKGGERVRVTVQLIDAATGGHLWAERYDRELKDLFALQDEIREKIVLALKVKLTPEEQAQFKRAPTNNLEAYDYYLRSLEFGVPLTKEANAQARQMCERALELDLQYAAAYARLSLTYWLEWFWYGGQEQTLERASELGQKAVALDESLPVAHLILGWVYLLQKQHDQAQTEMERTITLDPNFAPGYEGLSFVLHSSGKPQEAISVAAKAVRLSPQDLSALNGLGQAYVSAGQYEEAMSIFKKILARNPDHWAAHWGLAVIYSESGKEEEAKAEGAEILRITPNFSLERWKQRNFYKDPAVIERWAAALRKAGLK